MIPWLRAFGSWLIDAKVFWLCLAVVLVAITIVCRGPLSAEPRVRLTGMVLQLLGVATVAWGVRQTRLLFGHPSLTSRARAWLARFPTRGGRIYAVTGSGGVSFGGGAVYGFGHATRPSASLEDRIGALESGIQRLDDRLIGFERRLHNEARERSTALGAERRAREMEDDRLRARLEMSATGGLQITATGVVWLLLGVFFGTASNEIAFFLQ